MRVIWTFVALTDRLTIRLKIESGLNLRQYWQF